MPVSQPQSSNNSKSVSQYNVACYQQSVKGKPELNLIRAGNFPVRIFRRLGRCARTLP